MQDHLRRRFPGALPPLLVVMGTLLLLAAACGGIPSGTPSGGGHEAHPARGGVLSRPEGMDGGPCLVALSPLPAGEGEADEAIRHLQERVQTAPQPLPLLERLGWLYVSRARRSFEPGSYKLAEQTALCMESLQPEAPAALLIRGHALHNLHRFEPAEGLARRLVELRGRSFDHGLLGDVLMEQGKLSQAGKAYQRMIDLRPDIHGYSRVAHLRWLKGDLRGAIGAMEAAARAGSPRSPESAAWAHTRLAGYWLQAGEPGRALASSDRALAYRRPYPPALLARGRILLAADRSEEAVRALSDAARLSPLPEYEWALAEALRAAGRGGRASRIEARLVETGAIRDPRTLSLFLATRSEDVQRALWLARREYRNRADAFTLDALAWSLRAAGRGEEARQAILRALAENTQDARIFFHAGVIHAESGRDRESRLWLNKAHAIRQMLLPSERAQLETALGPNPRGAGS